MKRTILKTLSLLAPLAFLLSVTTGTSLASDNEGYKTVDDTIIYFAVLPAEIIRGHQKDHPEASMHGGVPGGSHVHHIMVALFEAKTFDRITDANVEATVTEIGMAGKTKTLEPFTVAEALTYGNYFEMPSQALYRVHVTVRRPGSNKTVETTFEYTHH
jgi:hypothetical protein